ncbi:hypothetical protein QVD17_03276 [Tagetes erecta]|uniref:Uncharacterized protein n=1 Tax=Tagetes erecta TaxID=13708 RepID=A0AAD8LH82_TARER|nr:hypothetical protein QVD17_03276 [Tagetes erecta]
MRKKIGGIPWGKLDGERIFFQFPYKFIHHLNSSSHQKTSLTFNLYIFPTKMLLRSSSNPALNSWFQQQNTILLSSPEPDFIHKNFKSTTVSLHNINSPTSSNDSPKKLSRASSESDLINLSVSKRRNSLSNASSLLSSMSVEEDVEAEEVESRGLLFSSSGLDVVDGNGSGGRIYGGGDGGFDHESDETEVYYKNMIEMNPKNALFLVNYAKYLKEVRGDVMKAEEYCSRAILVEPNDATALSMYADLIWETQKDALRARSYFDRAVKASPDDCYVMASYARFLWDADEDEEDVEEPCLLHEGSQQFKAAPMVAASWG